jgi:hypothetical protein
MRKKCLVLLSVHVIPETSLSQVIEPTERLWP